MLLLYSFMFNHCKVHPERCCEWSVQSGGELLDFWEIKWEIKWETKWEIKALPTPEQSKGIIKLLCESQNGL